MPYGTRDCAFPRPVGQSGPDQPARQGVSPGPAPGRLPGGRWAGSMTFVPCRVTNIPDFRPMAARHCVIRGRSARLGVLTGPGRLTPEEGSHRAPAGTSSRSLGRGPSNA